MSRPRCSVVSFSVSLGLVPAFAKTVFAPAVSPSRLGSWTPMHLVSGHARVVRATTPLFVQDRLGRAKSSFPGRKPSKHDPVHSTSERRGSVSFFEKSARCFLSLLVVISPCHPCLSPLLVTLTGERKTGKLLCATQQGNMELSAPPMAVVVRGSKEITQPALFKPASLIP